MSVGSLATLLLLAAAGAERGLRVGQSAATAPASKGLKITVDERHVKLFRRLAEVGGEQGWYNKTSAHTELEAHAVTTACAAGYTDSYKRDVNINLKTRVLVISRRFSPATEGSGGCGACMVGATHFATCNAPLLHSSLLGNLDKPDGGFVCSGDNCVVTDLTSAATTADADRHAVEADLASTFKNGHRCLSKPRFDGVDPKNSSIPSRATPEMLDAEVDEDCQRRTGMSKSYNDTCGLFRNQAGEQTTARLCDTQQRKTTISTMIVDNLELEILEVRFEHTYKIYHALSLSSFTYSFSSPSYCTLRVLPAPSHPAAESPRRAGYTR
jgi:hypothetical protein